MDNITINQTDKTNNNPKKRIEKDKLEKNLFMLW